MDWDTVFLDSPQRADRTLKDSEVNAVIERVVRMLDRRFDGKLR